MGLISSIGAGAAFLAGLLSFLSPCVLPLVPGYISFMSGRSLEELTKGAGQSGAWRKAGWASMFFVAGFSLVFTLLGASASAAGSFLRDHLDWFGKAAGALIVLFGLHMTGLLPIRWLYYEKRFQAGSSNGWMGAFLMGLAFAFGWTPCIGPILAGILALAAQEETAFRGSLLLLVYSLGLGIPFILTGFFVGRFIQIFNRYKPFIRWGEIFAGALLVAIGVMMFTNKLTMLAGFVPEFFLRFSQ